MKAFCLILIASTSLGGCIACKCVPNTRKEALCDSEWISLADIVRKGLKAEDNLLLEYRVEHVKVFKSNIGDELPLRIRTPNSEASCGVVNLQVGRQYLLAGKFGNGHELIIHRCEAIPAQDSGFNPEPGVLEWDRVPKVLRSQLLSRDFPDCSKS